MNTFEETVKFLRRLFGYNELCSEKYLFEEGYENAQQLNGMKQVMSGIKQIINAEGAHIVEAGAVSEIKESQINLLGYSYVNAAMFVGPGRDLLIQEMMNRGYQLIASRGPLVLKKYSDTHSKLNFSKDDVTREETPYEKLQIFPLWEPKLFDEDNDGKEISCMVDEYSFLKGRDVSTAFLLESLTPEQMKKARSNYGIKKGVKAFVFGPRNKQRDYRKFAKRLSHNHWFSRELISTFSEVYPFVKGVEIRFYDVFTEWKMEDGEIMSGWTNDSDSHYFGITADLIIKALSEKKKKEKEEKELTPKIIT